MKKLSAVIFILFLVCLPMYAQAANVTRILQPGNTYTFTGLDRRVISHVSAAGTGRYQFVSVNERGEVIDFGFAFGRFSISGQQALRISPLAPLSVTFDATRISLESQTGEPLRQIFVENTIMLENVGRTGRQIRTTQTNPFDVVITLSTGEVQAAHQGVRFPQFTLPPRGTATITAYDGGLTLYFPQEWAGDLTVHAQTTHTALAAQPLRAHQVYTLTFTGARNAVLAIEAASGDGTVIYDFILRDRQGFSIDHGEASISTLTLAPHQSLTLTPHRDATLFIPNALQTDVQIQRVFGEVSPAYYLIEAGEALRITNSDVSRTYQVNILDAFHYMLEVDGNRTYMAQNPAGTVHIPPLSVLFIEPAPLTGRTLPLEVRFPDSPAIFYTMAVPVFTYQLIHAGDTQLLSNNGADAQQFSITAAEGLPISVDFALINASNAVVDFGHLECGASITLEAGYRARLTVNEGGGQASLAFPLSYKASGLTVEASPIPALVYRTVNAGEVLRIENTSHRYNRPLLIANTHPLRGVSFEYVQTDNRNAVLSYGEGSATRFTLRYSGRLTLMPAENTSLQIAFPAEWEARALRFSYVTEAPLFRITLHPNQRLTLRNHAAHEISISNNRTALTIAPNTTQTITAPRGEDMHIWMPTSRARQMGLI
ncbi:MAG: hypothetical protein FWC16_13095 [Defluviitaleaceae bacterium]|nr:hypothetical protein [Defluviitaleaceae bacterium]